MKVAIVVICYNLDSRVFLLQMEAIKKFCKDDYVIEVFDNSNNTELSEAIRYHAEQLGINYKKTESVVKNGSESHSFAANLSYQLLKNEAEYFLYLDHDCIPVSSFSVIDILGDKLMAGVGQNEEHKYLWPGLLFLNSKNIDKDLIDFSPVNKFHLDTGGSLYLVIEKYGKENFIFFNEKYCQNPYYSSNKQYSYYSMLADSRFIHFIGGSNWINLEDNEARLSGLINIANEKISLYDNSNIPI